MRRFFAVVVAVTLVLLVLPATASAAPPLDVQIEVEEYLLSPGSFTAMGPAVDDGLVCATGSTSETDFKRTPDKKWGFNLQVFKQFTCDDGSGTFLMKLQVKVFFEGSPSTTFRWNVVDGTGAYASLHGTGSGVGLAPPGGAPYDILDVYSGKLH